MFRSHSSPNTHRTRMVVGRSRPQFENDLWSGSRYPPMRTESPDRGQRRADGKDFLLVLLYKLGLFC